MEDFEVLTDTEIAAQNAPRSKTQFDESDLAAVNAEAATRDNTLAASLRQSVSTNPDEAASSKALAQQTGIPADVIDRNKEQVTAHARVAQLRGVLAGSPILARQMADPEFARIAHDDAENLSLFERTLRTYLGASIKSGVESLLGAGAKLVDTMQPFTLSEQDAATLYKNDPAKLEELKASPGMFLSRFARAMQQASEATMQNVNSDAHADYMDLKYATLDPAKAAYLRPIKVAGDAIQSLPTTLALAVSAYLTKGVATRVEAEALAAGMSEELARKAAVHAASETMARLGAATEGAAGFGQQAIQTREAADKISNETLAQSAEYQKLLGGGYSPEAARLALSAEAANMAGAAGGAADAVTNYFGGAFLGKIIGEGGALLKRIAQGFGTEATTEAVQSGLEQLGQNAAVQHFMDPHQELLDGVAENIAQGFVVGGVMGGSFSAAAGRRVKAEAATKDADTLKKLFELAGADVVRERSPEEFAKFVQAAADEHDATAVFIDAATFAQAAHEKLDIAATMPETAAQLHEAIAVRGDLRIPLGELTAALPGTGLENTLLQHMRMSPDAPTLQEVQDKAYIAETQAAVEKAMAEHEFDTAQKQSSAAVEKELLGQLSTANRFTKDVNTAYAKLMASFYTVQAARLGITAEEMYVKYPLRIQAESIAGAAMDQRSNAGVRIDKSDALTHATFLDGEAYRQFGKTVDDVTPEQRAKLEADWQALPDGTLYQDLLDARTVEVDGVRRPIRDSNGELVAPDPAQQIAFWRGYAGEVDARGRPVVQTLEQSAPPPPFYSALAMQLAALKMGSGTAQAWKDALKGLVSKGVKQAEIEATGITDWLDMMGEEKWEVQYLGGPNTPVSSQAEGNKLLALAVKQGVAGGGEVKKLPDRVTKEQVTAFLQNNGIRVEEKILGGKSSFEASFGEWQDDVYAGRFEEEAKDMYLDKAKEAVARQQEISVEEVSDEEALPVAIHYAEQAFYDDPERQQFREIEVEANGKTYKFTLTSMGGGEVDLFAPANQGNELDAAGGESIPFDNRSGRADDPQIEAAIRSYLGEKLGIDFDSEGAPFADYTLPGGENYQVLLLTLPHPEAKGWESAESLPQFRSSHFDEPNILAHIRTTERTDAEGKRVLFVEEIQSDWAQKGKKEGFKEKTPEVGDDAHYTVEQTEHQYLVTDPQSGYSVDIGKGTVGSEEEAREYATRYFAFKADEQRAAQRNAVPPAPFVTKTEAWVALAMKRVVTYAVAHGFERVAWTTGEQQADRYSLSKQVRSIGWTHDADNDGKRVSIALADGRGAFTIFVNDKGIVGDAPVGDRIANGLVGKKLEDALGKAAAEKIMGSAEGSLEGEGLKIGGEGMKAFYDKIVPNVANDVLKKIDGGRVRDLNLNTVDEGPIRRQIRARDMDPDTVDVQDLILDRAPTELIDAVERGDHFDSRVQFKQPGFPITAKMREVAQGGLPLFQHDPIADEMNAALAGKMTQGKSARGQINFGSDIKQGAAIILLQNADLSTFLHESGHFYLEVLADMASQPEANTEIQGDMQRLLNWFGVRDLATWQAMSLDQKRPMHEQFARGFESYLFEGKAPNTELAGLFARFRAWMLNVYKQLAALNVTLTDEVRAVFDRMLSSNDEILQAEAARGFAPLFTSAAEMGATTEEWRNYQEQGLAATQEAVDLLQTRSLRDMKWLSNAKSKVLAKLQREAKGKRKSVEAEVATEVRQQPVYAALRFLTHGELPEGNLSNAERKALEDVAGQPNKLSIPDLKQMYGDGPAAPWRYLNTGKFGHLAAEDGLNPNMVAELFGFTSGDHLVREMLNAEPEATVIEGMTDQRMLERYGDLASPDAIERAANEAIHNEARAKFIATEMNALAKATGQRKVLVPAAKEFAATLIARKKLREIRPSQYTAAETRAGKNAERAKSLVEKATEKRNQLVNHYAAKAAFDALDEIEKAISYLRRVGDSKSIDVDYREQIQALLARFELRPISNKDAIRRESLVQWVEAQRAMGFEPVIDEDLLTEAKRMPYRELPLEEFRGLVDAVKNIEHLGRLKHRLLAIQDQRELQAVVDEAATSIEANAKRSIKAPIERTKWTKIKSGVAEFFAMHRKFAFMLREMDGHKDRGVLWKLFVRPMNEAGNVEAARREKATIELQKLLGPVLKEGRMSEKRFIPEIRESLSREGRIMVALNMGNAGNLQRLLDGDGWNISQAQAILNTLTKTEMDFVQGIWNFVGGFRGEIGAQQRRITGVSPEWVEPRALQTIHGEYAGGYIPAKYDTTRSTRSLSDEAVAGIMEQWRAKRGAAKTRDSFTKARANKVVDRPLRKDFGVITQHVTEVTHRLAWQEYLIDAQRLLRAPKIDNAIREHYGPEVLKALRDTIEDVAAGEVGAQNAFEGALNYLRTGATIAGLGWRITTSLLQPIGLTQSMVRIGPKYVAAGLVEWLGDAAKMENTMKRITEKSDFMRLRAKTMQREISEIRNVVSGKNSAIEASYFYMIQKMQLVADIPTWLGQYHKSVEAGVDEKTAVAEADQAVLDAQGGGQIKDLAAIQRGGPMLKLFTNFYSFFNTTYNLTGMAVGRTRWRDPVSVGRLAVDMLLLYSIPAAMGTLLKAALHSGDDGADDEKKLMRQLIADQLTYLLGTMVGLREVAGAAQTALGLPGDYQGPASVRVFAELGKLGKQVQQGEVDEALLKAANNTAGILFHYPAGQIGATLDGIVTMANGKTNNPGALLVGSNKK